MAIRLSVKDHVPQFKEVIRRLADTHVLVGVPADDEQPHLGSGARGPNRRTPVGHSTINNATLGYIHEHGAPEANIPPRPHLIPGVQSVQRQIGTALGAAAKAAFGGNQGEVDQNLNKAGLTAQSAVKLKITSNIPPPLKAATIAARRRRHPSRKAMTARDVTPLIDTAQYINSITYIIRKPK